MEQGSAGVPGTRPSSPPAAHWITGGAEPEGCTTVHSGALEWGAVVPVHRAPEAVNTGHWRPAGNAAPLHSTTCITFSFPPHIPTDINVSWRVRRAGPAQMVGFRHAHLYGEFQKSTAGQIIDPPPSHAESNLCHA